MTAQLNPRGDVAVLVPAAGAGVRLGPGRPKALRLLAGEPLLVHAVRRLAAAPSVHTIVVAAPATEVQAVRELLAPVAPVIVVPGGAERQASVAAALAAVPPVRRSSWCTMPPGRSPRPSCSNPSRRRCVAGVTR